MNIVTGKKSITLMGRQKDALEEEEVRRVLESLKGKVDAVAISGYASVRNQKHEQEAAKIAEEHKGQLEDATKKLLVASSQWLQQSMPGILKTELEKAATLAVREPVNAAAQRFEQATQVAERATSKLREAENSNVKTWVIGVLAAAVLGGASGGGLLAWSLNHASPPELTKDQQQAIQWGTALQAAWPKLSPQVQKVIKDSANGREGGN